MSNDQPMMMSRVQNESMGAQKAQSFFVSLFDACSPESCDSRQVFCLCCEHDAAAAVEYLVSFGVDVYRSETNKVTESVRISSHSSSVTAALVYYSRTSALSFDSRKRPSIHMPNLKCCSSDTQQVLVR